MTNALDVQVGGGHKKNLPIQPVENTQKTNLTYWGATLGR